MDCYVTKAQALYDLRKATAFVSGNELHDMFFQLLGESSPSGKEVIQQSDLSRKFLSLLGNREQATGNRGKRGKRENRECKHYRLLFTSQITLLYI